MKATPIWVTLVVAALALIGVVLTGLQAHRAAKLASEAARFGVRSDRYASWQMHKRGIYDDLLASVRVVRVQPTIANRLAMAHCFDRAFLVASVDTRSSLRDLWERASVPLDDLAYKEDWAAFIKALRSDVQAAKAPTRRWWNRVSR